MRRVFITVLVVSIVSGMLLADGISETSSNGKKSLEGEKVTFATFTQWYDTIPGLKEGLRKVEELTGVDIQVNVYPDDQFEKVVNVKLSTGEMEDFFAYYAMQYKMGNSDQLVPLKASWAHNVDPGALCWAKRASDGAIVGAPYSDASMVGAIYNKDVMEKAGVAIPIRNYEELLNACEKIKAIGVDPIFVSNNDYWTTQMIGLCSFNQVFHDNPDYAEKIMNNEIGWDEIPELKNMMLRAYGLLEKGYVNSNYKSADYGMGLEAVANGTAAMYVTGSWLYNEVSAKYPDKASRIGMMPFGLADNYLTADVNMTCNTLYLPASTSKHQQKVVQEIIETFMSDEVLGTLGEYMTSYSLNSVLNPKYNLWIQEMSGYIDSGVAVVEDSFIYSYFVGFQVGDFPAAMQNLFNGTDVNTALKDWDLDMTNCNRAIGTPGF